MRDCIGAIWHLIKKNGSRMMDKERNPYSASECRCNFNSEVYRLSLPDKQPPN
jgi:hypothetical protein